MGVAQLPLKEEALLLLLLLFEAAFLLLLVLIRLSRGGVGGGGSGGGSLRTAAAPNQIEDEALQRHSVRDKLGAVGRGRGLVVVVVVVVVFVVGIGVVGLGVGHGQVIGGWGSVRRRSGNWAMARSGNWGPNKRWSSEIRGFSCSSRRKSRLLGHLRDGGGQVGESFRRHFCSSGGDFCFGFPRKIRGRGREGRLVIRNCDIDDNWERSSGRNVDNWERQLTKKISKIEGGWEAFWSYREVYCLSFGANVVSETNILHIAPVTLPSPGGI